MKGALMDLTLRVDDIEQVADDVVSVTLSAADDGALPPWEPGAHLGIELPPGRRHYSLCGDLGAPTYTIAVLRTPDSRGGSRYIHDELVVGDVVHSRPPRNLFPLVEAPDYLFIAGGIGITPLLPMIRQVAVSGRPWRLVYGGRTRGSMAFLPLLEEYGDALQSVPQDELGVIDLDRVLAAGVPAAVYCCGPDGLLKAVDAHPLLQGTGVHQERFSADPDALSSGDDAPFEVECRASGSVVRVGAEETMLSALRRAGHLVESDCEEGICGTCELKLLAGDVDHRDDILTAEEREDLILPCVSRALSGRIAVDL